MKCVACLLINGCVYKSRTIFKLLRVDHEKIIQTYAEEENCEAIFRRSGSEFIILRIPMPENR
jgi:hypothetical protein